MGLGCDTSRHDHGTAVEVVGLAQDLAGVETDAQLQQRAVAWFLERLLHADGGVQRAARRREGDHVTVAQ